MKNTEAMAMEDSNAVDGNTDTQNDNPGVTRIKVEDKFLDEDVLNKPVESELMNSKVNQERALDEVESSAYENNLKRKLTSLQGKPKKYKSASFLSGSPRDNGIDIATGVKITADIKNSDDPAGNQIVETNINIFKNLEMMVTVELLTEYLARKREQGEDNVIVGELVSGYCDSLGIFYCTECKFVFPFEEYYLEHKKVGQCIFVCFSCGESFTFKIYSSYLQHLKTHKNAGTSVLSSFSGDMFSSDPNSDPNRDIPINTQRVNQCIAVKLRQYLVNLKEDSNFEFFDEVKLAGHLKGFYADVKTKDGEKFKVSSFDNLRYSLARYLKSHPQSAHMDIMNGPAFAEANLAFNKVLSGIKKTKKGVEEQHSLLSREDIVAIYNCEYLHPGTPLGLLNRVQMNIRLFFNKRTKEYLERMTKDTFMVDVFPTGKRCVVRRNEQIDEYMPEDRDDPEFCPVRTFELYLSKLNPSCDKLWQMPKEKYRPQDRTWYQNRSMGRDTLAKFMMKLKENVPLKPNYTNHSIRQTGNNFYVRMKLTPERIHQTTKLAGPLC